MADPHKPKLPKWAQEELRRLRIYVRHLIVDGVSL
ncbi:DUF7239 family protein [Streptomyces sp. DSM 41634]